MMSEGMVELQPIKSAPKDGTPVLARMRDDIFPGVRPEREDLERWNGVWAVVKHPGVYETEGRTWDHGDGLQHPHLRI
jgi:hypothetical protein